LAVKTLIKPSEYHDSVSLMLVAQELSRLPGVQDVAVVMGTEANKGILKQAGLLTLDAEAASANDLVIAVSAESQVLDQALSEAQALLQKKQVQEEGGQFHPKTLRAAVKQNPAANVAVISVAGRYAAEEAWEALHHGLHVLLFSDNVSLEDEIALKKYARDHGLLLMGPGAGTAILNGVALGFANVIPPGSVGIVSAAGTGLQEVSTLLAKAGVGITQGIGTGGRDLKEEVDGMMMLTGLQALQDDPSTQVIVLVSKPPAPAVAYRMLEQAAQSRKPTVLCLLGENFEDRETLPAHIHAARTLEEAAVKAASLALRSAATRTAAEPDLADEQLARLRVGLQSRQRYLRGLFSGGTLCYEAQVIWRDMLPEPVYSNAPLSKQQQLSDSNRSQGHSAIDLGEEEFTVGRLHPMIDNDLRIRRLLQEANDPQTALIMLDVVLGYGAHPDPAAELAPAIRKAQALAAGEGRILPVVGSITGTEEDPQRLSRQAQALQEAGMILCDSNAAAARLAARLVAPVEGEANR
jgi:succinyl-CoA synthetase alpha subunit